jgi:serine/threonine protein kinase
MDDLTQSFPIISNRYQIFRTIASGGMAVIYEAQDLILERKVALKILKRELSKDQVFQNKFRGEAKSSANLNHPNIVATYDFGFDRDRLYIVLELVDGTDLKSLIDKSKSVDLEKSVYFLKQASEGLSYAHSAGIVHCDIKPQNMLINHEEILKISDFGISRAIETITPDEKHSEVWGSPYYISPEQTRGEPPTTASDVYALGIIAYELVTGSLPFLSDNSSDLLQMHRVQKPQPPILLNRNISMQFNDLILQTLSKDPSLRPSNAKVFLEKIQAIEFTFSKENIAEVIEAQSNSSRPENLLKKNLPVDFATILLSLITLIFTGGLLPFWIYVLFTLNIFGR